MNTMYNSLEEKLISCRVDLQKFIYSLTRDKDASEEILQETIAIAYANLYKLKNPEKLKTWAFNIAKTETSHYFRKCNRINKINVRKRIDYIAETIQVAQKDLLESIMDAECSKEIKAQISKLDEKYAKIIMLHYYYDLELKVIADLCNINYSTVRTNHRRAIEKLKLLFTKGRIILFTF